MHLTTERLVLRPPTPDDLPAWVASFVDAEEFWYGSARSSLDENRAKLEGQIAHHDQHGFGTCTVELRETSETIGAAGLKYLGAEIEVGYRLLKAYWGHGYATEAAAASIVFGFDELRLVRIVAVALPTNLASRRVLEKCGMHEVGLMDVNGLEHVKYEIAR